MKTICVELLAFATTLASVINAQQEPMFTQYLDNQIYVNPAFAGCQEYLQITGIHRHQWAGVAGAPRSTTLALHAPLKFEAIGIGLDIMNDQIGPMSRFTGAVDFAYRIHFEDKGKLSFGLKAGIDRYQSNLRAVDRTGQDPNAVNLQGVTSPMFGAGIYYFAPNWFAGASVPRLIGGLKDELGGMDEARHFFMVAGALLPVGKTFQLRPSIQTRMTTGAPISADASLTGIWKSKLWVGLNYRIAESISFLVQCKIIDQLKLGYAFDLSLSQLNVRTVGSHEILLSYGFLREVQGLVSPRYF